MQNTLAPKQSYLKQCLSSGNFFVGDGASVATDFRPHTEVSSERSSFTRDVAALRLETTARETGRAWSWPGLRMAVGP